jgi:L-ascorbate metabolism protein UlaG (beta-lactamase superfamily)
MAQVGFQTWVHCARKYDPSRGIPAKNFLLPIVKHEMRRWHRRETAHSMGDTAYRVMRGEAVEHRKSLDKEVYPHGVDSLANANTMNSEEAAIALQEVWRMKRAIWDAAHEMGVPYKQWQNAYFRGCILTERVRPEDIKERFDVKSGSLSFFRSRLYKLAKERL